MDYVRTILTYFCLCVLLAFCNISTVKCEASIHTPMVNASNTSGGDVSFYCGVRGVQESWQYMKWIKMSDGEVIMQDNTTIGDSSKYKISGYYNLTVKNIDIDDDSWYQCEMGAEEYEAKLTVIDYPDSCHLYSEQLDDMTNLTCKSINSRPEATISWYREGLDITDYAYSPKPEVDSNGYGDTSSILSISEYTGLPGVMHAGYFYTCVIDLPGAPGVCVKDIWLGSAADGLTTNRVYVVLSFVIATCLCRIA